MFLWFCGLSFLLVVWIFRDAALDYRMLMASAALPAMLDLATGGGVPWLHSLVVPVAVLGAVMVTTIGRRAWRRRLLAVPIGLFMNLVLDAAWSTTPLFAWPLFGFDVRRFPPPLLARSWTVRLLMEAAGLVVLVWLFIRYDLNDRATRFEFLRTGRLRRDLVGPSGR